MSKTDQPLAVPLSEVLGSYATTASTAQQKTLTLADFERMAQALRDMPPEPIGEWMREQGRPPEQWRVVMPQKVRDEVQGPMFWPDYVAFSPLLEKPVFTPRGLWAWDLAPNGPVEAGPTVLRWTSPRTGG